MERFGVCGEGFQSGLRGFGLKACGLGLPADLKALGL